MIKVLNIISDRNIGGAGRCVLNFLKYYNRNDFSIKAVLPKDSLLKSEIEKLNTEVIEVCGIADKSLDVKAIGRIKKIIEEENPDIVHTHGTVTGRISAKLCKKKIIYTRHSVFPVSPKIQKGLGRFLNKNINEFLADRIIAVAEAAKDNLTDGGISEEKIEVVLNGVEALIECSEAEKALERQKYGINEEDFVVGILARLEDIKGHVYLIEAAEKIKKMGRKIKVLIAGTGAYEDTLKKIVAEKKLEDTVIFTGFLKNVRNFLSVINIQANASYGTEATSLALLEGMSLKIPAVVSNYGGNPGVINNGENGYIFRLRDSEDMAEKILSLIDNDEKYNYMKKRCIEIFNEKFTAEIYAGNIENVYKKVLKGDVSI